MTAGGTRHTSDTRAVLVREKPVEFRLSLFWSLVPGSWETPTKDVFEWFGLFICVKVKAWVPEEFEILRTFTWRIYIIDLST